MMHFSNYYPSCWLAKDTRSGAIYDIYPQRLDSDDLIVTVTSDGVTMVIGYAKTRDDAISICEDREMRIAHCY